MTRQRVVSQILDLTMRRAPTLGTARLICIDGPAGSGKTTLAARLAAPSRAPVLHLDDFYPGWSGLREIGALTAAVSTTLDSLAAGEPAHYARYDWHAERFVSDSSVHPAPLVVLEGVGAGHRAWSHHCTTLVWVEAPREVRRERGLTRDGRHLAAQWDRWTRDEDALHAAEATMERADVVVRT